MAFQIKNFRNISASMVNVSRSSQTQITDFSVGSVARTLMDSPAVEIEELYLQMLLGLQDAIPTAIYRAIGFSALDAMPSSGQITVHFQTPLIQETVIPASTMFESSVNDLQFYSTESVTLPFGALQAVIQVASVKAGALSNVSRNEISRFLNFPALSDSLIEHDAFTTGLDAESDAERKTRFIGLINSLSRGTLASIDYAARYATVQNSSGAVQEYVTRVGMDEFPGRVIVYLYGSGGSPSQALLASAQAAIDGGVNLSTGARTEGYRPAGVRVAASAAVVRRIDVGLTIGTVDGFAQRETLITAVHTALSRALSSIGPGNVLRAELLIAAVLRLAGVRSCSSDIASNITCAQSEVLLTGAVNIVWLPNA